MKGKLKGKGLLSLQIALLVGDQQGARHGI
jgi:hypothetical protein